MDDLVTARLVLHPMSVSEAERVVAGEPAEGERWAPGYPTAGDVAGSRRFVRACASTGHPHPFGAYEIRRREDGYAIGGVGFHGAPDETGTVTIGYGLVASAQGKGYATESLRELLRLARELGIARVIGDTHHDNIASQRVMTAAGMRLLEEDDELKHYGVSWPEPEPEPEPEPGPGPGADSSSSPS
ncbi:GNAT family N-acetyltransferase [Embleya sp. NBC_00896]|uniref:GNAT family N-acetyltransferase n=1 Tax=Embleya sp. NBC_00896 TaxID=2975961 RepID=UPI002F917FCE|nr:GNAT family N-acetyltransferase [Embleya sp. NBC_00896]